MPISVKCQFCGTVMKVKDQLAGKKIKCTDCGSHVVVGGDDDDDEGGSYALKPSRSQRPVDDFDDDDDFSPAPSRRGKQSNSTGLIIGVVAGVGVLLIFCLITPLVFMMRNRQAPAPIVVENNPPAGQQFDPQRFQPRFQQQQGDQAAQPGGFQPPAPQPAPQPGRFQQPARQQPVANENPDQGNPGGFQKPVAGTQARGTNWSAKADPPAQAPVAIELKKPLSLPLADSFEGPLFPMNGCQFYSTGGNGTSSEVREFYNVATGKRIGSVKGLMLDRSHRALSDDGQLFAAKLTFDSKLMVWDIKANKELGTLKIPGTFVTWLGFAASSHVMVLSDKSVTCWKLPSGDFERTLIVEARDDKSLATSPGGTYLAAIGGSGFERSLKLYDLESGKNAGEVDLPSGFSDVRGVAFSPDGKELAAVVTKGTDALLMVWDMVDGQSTASIELKDQSDLFHKWHRYKGRQLLWFPDQQRWLAFGQVVISRDTSSIVWSLPSAKLGVDRYAQVLDDTHLAIGVKEFGQRGSLVSVELTKEKLAEASKVIEQGGKAIDIELPKISNSDSGSARQLLVGGDPGDWQVRPDPAPTGKGKLLSQPLILKNRQASLESGVLSSASAARFVAQYSRTSNGSSAARRIQARNSKDDGPDTPVWLDVYDLAGGKLSTTTKIPFDSQLTSISPNGKRALLRLNEKKDRLDVVEVDGGKPVCGWRPYSGEKDDNSREIKAAVFIDELHVLTLNGGFNGTVIQWEIPSCKAVFKVEKASNPGASPGGKYVVASNSEMYRFFDAQTGDSVGAVKLPGPALAAAFHPNGESFAAMINDNGSTSLMIWKLADGSLEQEIPLGITGSAIKFTSKLNVLVNGTDLIDIPSKCLVWKYTSAGSIPIGITPDARQWYLTSRIRGDGITLNAVTMPHDDAARTIAKTNPRPDYVIAPGTAVTLAVNVAAPQAKPNLAAEVTQAFTKRLEQNDVTIGDGNPVVITVQTGAATSMPGNWEFRGMFGNKGNETVPKQKVEYSVVISRDGKPVWTRKGEVDNGSYGIINIGKGKTLAQHLNEQMWNQVTAAVTGQGLPRYLLTDDASKGLGQSWLTVEGIKKTPN